MQPKRSRCVSHLRENTLMFCGVCLVICSVFLPACWPVYYQTFVSNELKMTPTSKTYQAWKDSPVPIYIEFFFFNWTNRDTLEADGVNHIPQLQELGPYRFNERIERVNVTWNDDNNTVTYEQAKFWHFDPDNSKGTLDDKITTLNVVALTAAFTAREWGIVMKTAISSAFGVTKQEIHVVRSVRELLFDGYSDGLITMARSMPSFAGVKVPFDKFAWFYKRNGTTFMDGVFNMNTGAGNIGDLGKLEYWNYRKSTDYFEGECASVSGTTGQLFPPGQTRDSVRMFSPDLCRSISFEYSDDTQVHNVPGYKYVGGLSMLDNGTTFPDNECYCNGECVPSGVVNVTSCRFGAPAFASFPHFYLADPFFSESVRGMRSVREKHQFYLILEPTTGIPLDVAARFQINLLLQPLKGMRLYDNVPMLFFPMVWFQQRATMTPELALSLRTLLLLSHLGVVVAVVGAVTGCLLMCYSLYLCFKANRTRTLQLEKDHDDSNVYEYVAASELSKISGKGKSNSRQYIVMTPKSDIKAPYKV